MTRVRCACIARAARARKLRAHTGGNTAHPQPALNAVSVVEFAVLKRVLDGKVLFSRNAVHELRSIPGLSSLPKGALVQRAVNAIMRLGILYPVGRGTYEIESPLYERYLKKAHPPA